MTWNEKLQTLRVNQNKTQRDVGRLANIHWVQICRIESGGQMPKAYTLYKICKALGTTVEYIFEGMEQKG